MTNFTFHAVVFFLLGRRFLVQIPYLSPITQLGPTGSTNLDTSFCTHFSIGLILTGFELNTAMQIHETWRGTFEFYTLASYSEFNRFKMNWEMWQYGRKLAFLFTWRFLPQHLREYATMHIFYRGHT